MHTIYRCYYIEVGVESYPVVASVVLKYSKFGQIQVKTQRKKFEWLDQNIKDVTNKKKMTSTGLEPATS